MSKDIEPELELVKTNLSFLQRNVADILTLCRIIIALVILALSFAEKSAYLAVIILALVGVATDILDGRAARRYLGENREGRLGKHDVEVDTFFIMCILAYFSFSGIVIHFAIGMGWIGLVLVAALVSGRNLIVLIASEIITVIGLLIITFIYDQIIFGVIIAPLGALAIIINWRRLRYIIFTYWPSLFRK